jgi:RNA polymerase sigma-70 factor (ECF subfamily)
MGMEGLETSTGGTGGAFQPTLWSLVLRAQDPASRQQALETLIRTYWKPLYHFVRRKGNDVEASKDLTQGFFAMLLSRDSLRTVDRSRGRFRTFLLRALENYMADEYERARAQKRGGGALLLTLDFRQAEEEYSGKAPVSESPDRAFERDWALRVLAQAMALLRQATGDLEFEVLKNHLSSNHPDGPSYEEMARSLGTSVEDIRNRVRRLRLRYKETILEVLRSNTDSEEEAKEELRLLRESLS